MLSTSEDLRAFAERIQRYWGAHLYVRVVAEGTPAMDWRTVQIPTEFVEWSTPMLLQVLLHEWGHRTISPLSPARLHLWRRIAMTAGLSEAQGQTVANVAADALVDRAYLLDPHWGVAYRRGMCDEIEYLAERRAPGNGPGSSFRRIYCSFHSRLVREHGPGPAPPPGHPVFVDPATPEERDVARGLWEIVYDDARDDETRVRDLARLLRPWLPLEIVIHLRVSIALSGTEPGGRPDLESIVTLSERFGIRGADLAPHLDPETVERLRLRAKRLALYARVVPAVNSFLGKRERMRFAGYRPWRAGRPVRDLDVLATLQRSPFVLPNVNTLARHFDRHGSETGRGAGAVVLVIDDSGSTSGDVLEREKEAAFAVIAAARAYADEAACVVFGTEVSTSIPPSTRYVQLEEAICSLSSSAGGTALAPALSEAARLARRHERFTVLVMTDAEVSDSQEVGRIVRDLPKGCRIVTFAFNDVAAIRSTFGQHAGRRVRVFSADPAVPFSERALEEIYA